MEKNKVCVGWSSAGAARGGKTTELQALGPQGGSLEEGGPQGIQDPEPGRPGRRREAAEAAEVGKREEQEEGKGEKSCGSSC